MEEDIIEFYIEDVIDFDRKDVIDFYIEDMLIVEIVIEGEIVNVRDCVVDERRCDISDIIWV